MTTRRLKSQGTSREGVNFVRTVVERQNCTFHEIDTQNDLGNDAYIELVVDENATGCCVAVQIKSGASYQAADGSFVFSSDRDHFEYWASHTLPVAAIIYNPSSGHCVWTDVSARLRASPQVIERGPYTVRIEAEHHFDIESFSGFRDHFLGSRPLYSSDAALGQALVAFAAIDDEDKCFDGLKALFSFHRQRIESWYYLINCFGSFRGNSLLRSMVYVLTHLPGHGDIAWGPSNITNEAVRRAALERLKKRFGRPEVVALLESVDDFGFERGKIGQSAHAIIDVVPNRDTLLRSIAFDSDMSDEIRGSAFMLWAYYRQNSARGEVLRACSRYLRAFPDSKSRWMFDGIADSIRTFGYFAMY